VDVIQRDSEPIPVQIIHLWMALDRVYDRDFHLGQSRPAILYEVMAAGEISQSEIHRRLNMEAAAVTRLCKEMEADGLIKRRTDPVDNRFSLVSLTDSGKERIDRLCDFCYGLEKKILNGLSETQVAQILGSLLLLREQFEKS